MTHNIEKLIDKLEIQKLQIDNLITPKNNEYLEGKRDVLIKVIKELKYILGGNGNEQV